MNVSMATEDGFGYEGPGIFSRLGFNPKAIERMKARTPVRMQMQRHIFPLVKLSSEPGTITEDSTIEESWRVGMGSLAGKRGARKDIEKHPARATTVLMPNLTEDSLVEEKGDTSESRKLSPPALEPSSNLNGSSRGSHVAARQVHIKNLNTPNFKHWDYERNELVQRKELVAGQQRVEPLESRILLGGREGGQAENTYQEKAPDNLELEFHQLAQERAQVVTNCHRVNKRHYAAMSECNIQVVFDGSNERSNRVVTSSAKRTRIEPGFVEPNHYDTTLGDIYVQKTPRIIPRPRENRKAEAEENIRGNMKKKENRKKRRQYRRLPLDHPEAAIVKLVNLDPSVVDESAELFQDPISQSGEPDPPRKLLSLRHNFSSPRCFGPINIDQFRLPKSRREDCHHERPSYNDGFEGKETDPTRIYMPVKQSRQFRGIFTKFVIHMPSLTIVTKKPGLGGEDGQGDSYKKEGEENEKKRTSIGVKGNVEPKQKTPHSGRSYKEDTMILDHNVRPFCIGQQHEQAGTPRREGEPERFSQSETGGKSESQAKFKDPPPSQIQIPLPRPIMSAYKAFKPRNINSHLRPQENTCLNTQNLRTKTSKTEYEKKIEDRLTLADRAIEHDGMSRNSQGSISMKLVKARYTNTKTCEETMFIKTSRREAIDIDISGTHVNKKNDKSYCSLNEKEDRQSKCASSNTTAISSEGKNDINLPQHQIPRGNKYLVDIPEKIKLPYDEMLKEEMDNCDHSKIDEERCHRELETMDKNIPTDEASNLILQTILENNSTKPDRNAPITREKHRFQMTQRIQRNPSASTKLANIIILKGSADANEQCKFQQSYLSPEAVQFDSSSQNSDRLFPILRGLQVDVPTTQQSFMFEKSQTPIPSPGSPVLNHINSCSVDSSKINNFSSQSSPKDMSSIIIPVSERTRSGMKPMPVSVVPCFSQDHRQSIPELGIFQSADSSTPTTTPMQRQYGRYHATPDQKKNLSVITRRASQNAGTLPGVPLPGGSGRRVRIPSLLQKSLPRRDSYVITHK